MYLCVCHALNERAVKEACGALSGGYAGGTCTAASVYRHLGVKPQCGKCVRAVQETVRAHGMAPADARPHA